MKATRMSGAGGSFLALAVLVIACGSDGSVDEGAGSDVAAVSTTTTAETVEAGIDLDADPAEAAALVIDALNAEADALVEPIVQHIARRLQGAGLESNIELCTEERNIRSATVASLPETIGDIRLEERYAAMRTSYVEFVAAHAESCDRLEAELEDFEAEESLFTALQMELEEFGVSADQACLEAVEPFAEYGRLNCFRESDKPPSIDLGAIADAQTNDADPLAGPTGGAREPWVELPPGPAELSWFPRPFAIDHPEPLNLQAAEDYVWITEAPDGATFGLYALDALADPTALRLFEVTETIPVPDDLGDWFDALPVTVTAETEVEVGGAPATKWEFSPDREATIEATGDVSAALAASAVHEDIAIVSFTEAPEPEQHVLWHVRTDDGPVLVHVIHRVPRELAFAESVLASISFG